MKGLRVHSSDDAGPPLESGAPPLLLSARPARKPTALTALTISSTVMVMILFRKRLTIRLRTGLAIWVLAVGATLPLLDRDLLGADVAFDSEHHTACRILFHDHTLCSHFGTQRWATVPAHLLNALPPSLVDTVVPMSRAPHRSRLSSPTNPRAPPTL